jgi:hypothetical protein
MKEKLDDVGNLPSFQMLGDGDSLGGFRKNSQKKKFGKCGERMDNRSHQILTLEDILNEEDKDDEFLQDLQILSSYFQFIDLFSLKTTVKKMFIQLKKRVEM